MFKLCQVSNLAEGNEQRVVIIMNNLLPQASDNVRMSNASTIYVMDDETSGYDLANHDNMAYVQDEDPRHD